MKEKLIKDCKNVLSKYSLKIVELYSNYALLLNACDVARKRYENLEENIKLSTIQNIPKHLKKPLDLEYVFYKEDLAIKYKSDILDVLISNFIGELISVFDACLEEMYEEILKDQGEDEKDITNKIRNSWRNDNIIDYFINTFKMKKPQGKLTTPTLAFNLYKELREFRHAIIHNNGVLSEKNKNNLLKLSEETLKNAENEGIDKDLMLNMYKLFKESGFIKDDILKPDVNIIYFLRYWILDEIAYLSQCMDEMKV